MENNKLLSLDDIEKKRLRGDTSRVAAKLNLKQSCILKSLETPSSKRHNDVIRGFSEVINEREETVRGVLDFLMVSVNKAINQIGEIPEFPNIDIKARCEMLSVAKKKVLATFDTIDTDLLRGKSQYFTSNYSAIKQPE